MPKPKKGGRKGNPNPKPRPVTVHFKELEHEEKNRYKLESKKPVDKR